MMFLHTWCNVPGLFCIHGSSCKDVYIHCPLQQVLQYYLVADQRISMFMVAGCFFKYDASWQDVSMYKVSVAGIFLYTWCQYVFLYQLLGCFYTRSSCKDISMYVIPRCFYKHGVRSQNISMYTLPGARMVSGTRQFLYKWCHYVNI